VRRFLLYIILDIFLKQRYFISKLLSLFLFQERRETLGQTSRQFSFFFRTVLGFFYKTREVIYQGSLLCKKEKKRYIFVSITLFTFFCTHSFGES